MIRQKVDYIIDEIVDQYLYADETNRPWIIGFSGGKDSTVLLQLVWKAIERVKELSGIVKRDVYVVCNDTLIENPIISDYVSGVLKDIEEAAATRSDMPIQVERTNPRLEDSYWVNMIGRGYPTPNSYFRWCTERLKIKPTSRFIREQIDEKGEAIILIGTRSDESQTRAKSIEKHNVKGKRLHKHPNHNNAFIYAPIKNLTTEEVWYIINTMPSPWGSNNDLLFELYSSAEADDYECPTMVTNKNHKSCGQSRFGCWTCTVVREDKSMSAQIDNGFEWLKPLLKFRNDLYEERSDKDNRFAFQRNGRPAINDMGTYSFDYRAKLLNRLLSVQKEIQETKPDLKLISDQELIAIQTIWYRDMNFEYRVSNLYQEVYQTDLNMKDSNEKFQQEEKLLRESCKKHPEDFQLIQDLLKLQRNKALLNKKRGLKDDIENRIEKHVKDFSK